MRVSDTLFGSAIFKALSIADQAVSVMNNEDELAKLSYEGLSMAATILLRAQCKCKFIEIEIDESTGQELGIERRKHLPDCPASRIPVNEDLSDKALLARARRIVLMEHSGLIMLEEKSVRSRKRETRYHE